MYQYPCKNCKDRSIDCHRNCEKYLTAKAADQKITANMKKAKSEERVATGFLVESIQKNKQRYKRRK